MSAHRTASVTRRVALAAVLGSAALGVQFVGADSASAATTVAKVSPAGVGWQAVSPHGVGWQSASPAGVGWQ